MASISSLSGGSSSSSIYGSRNVISGLASGLDTESMIENAVSGYQMKLSSLQQSKTKVEWKQEAYRSMITKLVSFSQKYTSYTSGTNLLSSSFFDNATKVTTLGSNASKISATGRTSSNVKITGVSQVATATTYSLGAEKLGASNVATKEVDVEGTMDVGLINGNMTLSYGNKSISISFNEGDVFADAEAMAAAINKKLEEETIAFDSGNQEKASERIKAVASDDGTISFEKVKSEDGNTLKISRVSGNLGEKLGIGTIASEDTLTSFAFDADKVKEEKAVSDILSEKGFTITYNGKTVTVKGPTEDEISSAKVLDADGNEKADATYAEKYLAALQAKIDASAIGAGKIKVSNAYAGSDESKVQFRFDTEDSTDSFSVSSTMAEKLGMEGGLSNKLNTSRTLEDILGADADWGNWEPTEKKDSQGNVVKDSEGNPVMEYTLKINETSSIKVTKDMTIQQLMDKFNSSAESSVKMNYSAFTGEITFTAKHTGKNEIIDMSEGLAGALFAGGAMKAGENAVVSMEVNGKVFTDLERSSNTFEVDGLSITLKEAFSEGDAVTFSMSSDADKIVDAVKAMVADYNAMMTEIKEAYSTMPLKNSKGKDYMPLTDEDQADMSESAVANYEKKAKTGLLFADRDLSNLYSNMTDALRAFGVTGIDGTGIGITTSFSNGTTTLVVDENALRSALENHPDKVKEVFVGKNGNDGVMQKMKNQLDAYAGTTGASKGILVNKAGSTLAPTSIYQNTLQKEIDGYEEEIEKWQDKIADKIDYYNKKFTTLEKLIAQMNNQSSMLMGLSGGY